MSASRAAGSFVAVGTVPWRVGGGPRLTLVAQATFAIVHRGLARLVAPEPLAAEDLTPAPPRAGVVMTGHARPCLGGDRGRVAVRLAVVSDRVVLDKTLHVLGDRAPGDAGPRAFDRLPLTWERTIGGPAHPDNPRGREDGANVIDPRAPGRPASFAPLSADAASRTRWIAGIAAASVALPDLPPGLDLRFFSVAPSDQQLDGLAGDEWIVLDGVHALLPRVETRLPNVSPVATWSPTGSVPVPVAMSASLLRVDADRLRLHLIWRGTLDVDEIRPRGRADVTLPRPGASRAPPAPPAAAQAPALPFGAARPPFASAPEPGAMGSPPPRGRAARTATLPLGLDSGPPSMTQATMDLSSFASQARSAMPFVQAAPLPPRTLPAAGPLPGLPFAPHGAAAEPAPSNPTAVARATETERPIAPFPVAPPRPSDAPRDDRPLPGAPWSTQATPAPAPPREPPSAERSTRDTLVPTRDDSGTLNTDFRIGVLRPVTPFASTAMEPPRRASAQGAALPLPGAPWSRDVAAPAEEVVAAQSREGPERPSTAPPPAMPGGPGATPPFRVPAIVAPPTVVAAPARISPPDAAAPAFTAPAIVAPPALVQAVVAPPALVSVPNSASSPPSRLDAAPRSPPVGMGGLGAALGGAPPPDRGMGVRLGASALAPEKPALPGSEAAARVAAENAPDAAPPRAPLSQEPPATTENPALETSTMTSMAALLARSNAVEPPAPSLRDKVLAAVAAREPLRGFDLVKADLHGLDLTGARLSTCKLAGADLSAAKLHDADLADADLTGAILTKADLTRADLTRTDLSRTQAQGAVARGARVNRTRFVGAVWDDAILEDLEATAADMTGLSLARAQLSRSVFVDLVMEGARGEAAVFDGAKLAGVKAETASFARGSFKDADLTGARFDRGALDEACFDRATLTKASFERATLARATFTSAGLDGANFTHATADDAVLDEASVEGADLRNSRLTGASLVKAKLRGIIMPRGDLSRAKLTSADLTGANLRTAKLSDAKLDDACLDGADLRDADLTRCDLTGASRSGAKLQGAKLKDVTGMEPS